MTNVCLSWLDCVHDFQTLASGVLAVAAAVIGGRYILRSTRLPLIAQRERDEQVERRKALVVAQVLAKEFFRVNEMARQVAGTIKVVIAAEKEISEAIRARTLIDLHPIVDNWEMMSLLPEDLFRKTLEFKRALDRHNFDMRRAGGSYGDDNFRRHVQDQVKALALQAHGVGNAFEIYTNRLLKELADPQRV